VKLAPEFQMQDRVEGVLKMLDEGRTRELEFLRGELIRMNNVIPGGQVVTGWPAPKEDMEVAAADTGAESFSVDSLLGQYPPELQGEEK
jgi:hypothetical protein